MKNHKGADQIHRAFHEIALLRSSNESHPSRSVTLRAVRAYQSKRFQVTYHDLFASVAYGPACNFFLTEIYGDQDFSQRDREFERIAKDFRKAQKEKNESLFLKVDKELNELTITAAKNEYAGAAMASLHGMSRRFWFGNSQHIQNISDMAALHAAIAEAISAGKDTEAGKALDKLVDHVEEFTKKTLISSE
jgi:hypothetical protein